MSLISAVFGTEPALKPKTVAGVMGAFHNTIRQLRDVQEHHETQADAHAQSIKDLESKRLASLAESKQAAEVAAKMTAIVGEPVASQNLAFN